MNKDIEQRFKKYKKLKESDIHYLDTIKKNRPIFIEFIDNAIEEVNALETKYIEGYEVRVANEIKNPIDNKEFVRDSEWGWYNQEPENLENIQIDIVLKNEIEEITIGKIDCDVRIFNGALRGDLKRYDVHLNNISIFEEYKDRGYGTFILRHIPMIISDLYKVEVYRVTTTMKVIEFDKYKIYETKYSERIEGLKRWLIRNNYTENFEYIKLKDDENLVFELDQTKRESINIILSSLEDEIENLCFRVWRYDNHTYVKTGIEECKKIVDKLLDNKYSSGIKDRKILGLKNLREKFIKKYDEQKKIREDEIKLIDEIIKFYNYISMEQLKVLDKDSIDDIVIKLFLESLNLRRVSEGLERLGYMGKNKQGEKRKYTDEQVKNMIIDSETSYTDLKKYSGYVLYANRRSQ
ncbi:hypothetical protein FC778_15365 [Clostridium botulinum]|nr:hypothetical protein [Clostridium botulinum]